MDSYDHDGKVVFGKMTFTEAICLSSNLTEYGEIMVQLINLPEKMM